MSPMTMWGSENGRMGDLHLMYLGARDAAGFGLVFSEQIAVSPERRTTGQRAGIYDGQIDGHRHARDAG